MRRSVMQGTTAICVVGVGVDVDVETEGATVFFLLLASQLLGRRPQQQRFDNVAPRETIQQKTAC